MLLGGVGSREREVLRLASAVKQPPLSGKLSMAWTLRSPVLNLTVAERQTILAILDEPPYGLEGLRDLLLVNPAWRVRERL